MDRVDAAHTALVRAHFDGAYPMLAWRAHLAQEARETLGVLQGAVSDRTRLTLGVFEGARLVAWSFGWQLNMDSGSFYMANSAVLASHRRRGLYRALLERTLIQTRELGFQVVTSRHVATNNPILIAKLQAGFQIAGLELSEVHGSLVHLRYFHNAVRREAHQVRSGLDYPQHPAVQALYAPRVAPTDVDTLDGAVCPHPAGATDPFDGPSV